MYVKTQQDQTFIRYFFVFSEQDVQYIHLKNILIIPCMNILRENFYSSKRIVNIVKFL